MFHKKKLFVLSCLVFAALTTSCSTNKPVDTPQKTTATEVPLVLLSSKSPNATPTPSLSDAIATPTSNIPEAKKSISSSTLPSLSHKAPEAQVKASPKPLDNKSPKASLNPPTLQPTVNPTIAVTAAKPNEKVYTLAQLKQFNGQNGNSAYVAVDGMVYDVTNNRQWAGGMHKGFEAGQDLSKEIHSMAPHGTMVLKNLKVVGKLE